MSRSIASGSLSAAAAAAAAVAVGSSVICSRTVDPTTPGTDARLRAAARLPLHLLELLCGAAAVVAVAHARDVEEDTTATVLKHAVRGT